MAAKHNPVKHLIIPVLVCLLFGSYIGYILTEPISALQPTATFSYSRPAKSVPLDWPSYGEAAVGATGYGVLAAHGDDQPRPTASTIKVLTALAVLREKPLAADSAGPSLTLTADDVASYNKYVAEDGSVVRVAAGEQISEYQALEALLLPSANNMAETLARWAFGSIDAYTTFANTYARQLGMAATTVTDPSGFLPTTVSTAHDLILLGQAALANTTVAQIVREPSAIIPVQGSINNVDAVLGQDGIIGIKTGNNDQDPGCFLAAAQTTVGTHIVTILSVIQDAPNLYTALHDSLPLLTSTAAGFHEATAVQTGATVASYQAPWQGKIDAAAAHSVTFVSWDGDALDASSAVSVVTAPTAASTSVGTLTVTDTATANAYTTPIILSQPLHKPNVFWRFIHPDFVQ